MAAFDRRAAQAFAAAAWRAQLVRTDARAIWRAVRARRSSSQTRPRRPNFAASPRTRPQSSSSPASATARPQSHLAAVSAGDDELLLICPSDHHIGDLAAFHTAIGIAREAAETGQHRHLRHRARPSVDRVRLYCGGRGEASLRPVDRFVEKPPLEKAQQMIEAGGHYWNAGIFLGSARTWRAELERPCAGDPRCSAGCARQERA